MKIYSIRISYLREDGELGVTLLERIATESQINDIIQDIVKDLTHTHNEDGDLVKITKIMSTNYKVLADKIPEWFHF